MVHPLVAEEMSFCVGVHDSGFPHPSFSYSKKAILSDIDSLARSLSRSLAHAFSLGLSDSSLVGELWFTHAAAERRRRSGSRTEPRKYAMGGQSKNVALFCVNWREGGGKRAPS